MTSNSRNAPNSDGPAHGEIIDTESSREKTIRQGHISLLHRWWARQPNVLTRVATYLAITDEQRPPARFLADLGSVNPPVSTLTEACDRIRDASRNWVLREAQLNDRVDSSTKDTHTPSAVRVLDPFAGGGAIPLEASRLGCGAYAGDLSPVAYRILRATVEYPANLIASDAKSRGCGAAGEWSGLANELRHWARKVEQLASDRLSDLFPPDRDSGIVPDRFFWFTFIRCRSSDCGTAYPMQQSLGLVQRPEARSLSFTWTDGCPAPVVVDSTDSKQPRRTFVCPVCGSQQPATAITPQDLCPARLYALRRKTEDGRRFDVVVPDEEETFHPWSAQHDARLASFLGRPDSHTLHAELPAAYEHLRKYGLTSFKDLLSPRQLLVASEYVMAVREILTEMQEADLQREKIEALGTYLGFFLAHLVDRNSRLCSWNMHKGDAGTTFDRLAAVFPRVFVERSPFGLMESWLATVIPSVEAASSVPAASAVYQGNAARLPFEADFFDAVVTDPPFYDRIPYADLSKFFWVWESMIPTVALKPNQESPAESEFIESKQTDDDNHYRQQMVSAFTEICRVLKPGRKLCLIFSGKATGSFQEYVDLCQQAGLEFVDVKRVPVQSLSDMEKDRQFTYLIYLRKPNTKPVREPLRAAEASALLDAANADEPVLYAGLAKLIAKELDEVDIAEILPAGGKGDITEQIMEVLAEDDPRELLEKCFSRRELRDISRRLCPNTEFDVAAGPIEVVLSHFGFLLPSTSSRIDGATQVRQRLRSMQSKIAQAKEKTDIRGPFVEGCTAVERLLRVSIWGWAQLVFGLDRDSQLLLALQQEDASKRYDLTKLSAGHIVALFRRLPDLIAASPMALTIERKYGRRHVYFPSNKRTKFAQRLGEVFTFRNRVEHDKDGYWTNIDLVAARAETAPVLSQAEQLLLALVEARAIPTVVEPIRETRDKWNRKSYVLSMDDGTDLEVGLSVPLTLGSSYLYYGSEVNPRPVDPFVLAVNELGIVP